MEFSAFEINIPFLFCWKYLHCLLKCIEIVFFSLKSLLCLHIKVYKTIHSLVSLFLIDMHQFKICLLGFFSLINARVRANINILA